MTHHFGILIPSTNTTVEAECRLLPDSYQAHFGRMMTAAKDHSPFAPSRDEDIDYQSKLLATARVELILLIQTSASLFSDGYDEVTTARITREAGGIPAMTSAQAVGRALQALGIHRMALVSPYSEDVIERAGRYFATNYVVETVVAEGFAATDAYEIGAIEPQRALEAFERIDRPEIEAFVVPGGNFPTLASVKAWENKIGKPVITTNQAAFWAMFKKLSPDEKLPDFGRLFSI